MEQHLLKHHRPTLTDPRKRLEQGCRMRPLSTMAGPYAGLCHRVWKNPGEGKHGMRCRRQDAKEAKSDGKRAGALVEN